MKSSRRIMLAAGIGVLALAGAGVANASSPTYHVQAVPAIYRHEVNNVAFNSTAGAESVAKTVAYRRGYYRGYGRPTYAYRPYSYAYRPYYAASGYPQFYYYGGNPRYYRPYGYGYGGGY